MIEVCCGKQRGVFCKACFLAVVVLIQKKKDSPDGEKRENQSDFGGALCARNVPFTNIRRWSRLAHPFAFMTPRPHNLSGSYFSDLSLVYVAFKLWLITRENELLIIQHLQTLINKTFMNTTLINTT